MLQPASVPSSPARPPRSARLAHAPRSRVVTGRTLAHHRLTMGLALAAVAVAAQMHHYRLSALEQSERPLSPALRERWEKALREVATKRLQLLSRQGGWTLATLPAPMGEVFALYAGHAR